MYHINKPEVKPRKRNKLDVHLKALANEDTLLPTQMFPRLPTRATFVADTNFVSGTQKMFLILIRNILCPQQVLASLRSPRNIMSNNVSATMCPRLPGPLTSSSIETFMIFAPQFTHICRLPVFFVLNTCCKSMCI